MRKILNKASFVIKKTYPALPEDNQGCSAKHLQEVFYVYIYSVSREKLIVPIDDLTFM